MKQRILSLALVLCLLLSLPVLAAEGAAPETIRVNVTIANAGTLVLTQANIPVSDADGDGALTINDAMLCTHAIFFEGGAAAGYGSAETDYGLSMTKLWGVENGGAYGYYVNNASAWSLADPIQAGDYITAFVYSDTTTYADQYTYFDFNDGYVVRDTELQMTLSAAAFDADYQPITVPVANASIVVNGTDTGLTTDENGNVTLSFAKPGEYTITATSADAVIVPPVAKVTVGYFADCVSHWARPEIEAMAEAGYMNGDENGNFNPSATMTRAQLVTTLFRVAAPAADAIPAETSFTDVAEGAYYAEAVRWASANGIVTGTSDTTFSPNAPVTRQQLAAILFRFAQLQGIDVSVGEDTNILSYNDAADVQEYAISAMQWTCGAGLVGGYDDGTLRPFTEASRAEVAVILTRFQALTPAEATN